MTKTCALCRADITDEELCRHHWIGYEDDWALYNQQMCNLIHRGKVKGGQVSKDKTRTKQGQAHRPACQLVLADAIQYVNFDRRWSISNSSDE
jgi:hypothetical protein